MYSSSVTAAMTSTGEAEYDVTPEARAALTAPPAATRAEYVERRVAATGIYGSAHELVDDDEVRAQAEAAYDRCFYPEGQARQAAAVARTGSFAEMLRALQVPTLVLHGDRDTLVDPSGGRRIAELIPGARYVEIAGMGHDYPRAFWDRWIEEWLALVSTSERS